MHPSKPRPLAALLLAASLAASPTVHAQATQSPTPPPQSPAATPSPLADLTPEERQRYDAATKSFTAGQFAMALPVFKDLVRAHPTNLLYAKFAAESAIDVKETPYALQLLTPIETAHPNDWQAAVLLARLYAETGDKPGRDREIAHLDDLHQHNRTPPSLTQYILEKVHLPDGKLLILWNSVFPWGNYKVVNYARLFDPEGHLLLRMTLETADFDQPAFAKEHPQEAAFGDRRYSYDGYSTPQATTNGGQTETHMTFGFVDKKPTYDEVRERFLSIAAGKAGPMSKTDRTTK